MSLFHDKTILAANTAGDFIGRSGELTSLVDHAKGDSSPRGILLLSAPGAGASELLKQVYDKLFRDQDSVIPFYFAVRQSDKSSAEAAVRFSREFLSQTIAFRRGDPRILNSSADIRELASLAMPSDGRWMHQLIEMQQAAGKPDDDERSFLRNRLSAPLRAESHRVKSFVLIDDLHEAAALEYGERFIEELKEIFSRAGIPFVFASRRRFPLGPMSCRTLALEPLFFEDAGRLAQNIARRSDVRISEQTRDLIAAQLAGNPKNITFLFESAREKGLSLESFHRLEQLYADEIFGGRIGKACDKLMAEIIPAAETLKKFLALLHDALEAGHGTPLDLWQHRSGLDEEEFRHAIELLNTHEFIRHGSGSAGMNENETLEDYVRARYRLDVAGESRALVVGDMLSDFLKRAPKLMARLYRRTSAIGLRDLLAAFNCQEVPRGLIDYEYFKNHYKGAHDDEIERGIAAESEKIIVPHIVYTAASSSFYPPIAKLIDEERSAVGTGFSEGKYTDDDEIAWIAAEIDSKLDVSGEQAEFWCDRLEMIALASEFRAFKIWLISPEGFAPDAMDVLRQRQAFGSSRRQADMLVRFLNAEPVTGEPSGTEEYEMIVPMGEDTELIAAQAVEQIAKRHNFPPRAINQIKTALVEACINAAEHSRSIDRKIHQKFAVDDKKITVTVSNRGVRLTDRQVAEPSQTERRGWGLNLMKRLMDDVAVEQTDDGTRISMTKYLSSEAA